MLIMGSLVGENLSFPNKYIIKISGVFLMVWFFSKTEHDTVVDREHCSVDRHLMSSVNLKEPL